jgi:rod shape-determining protein MreC
MKLEMLYAARPCVMEFIPREHEVSEGDEVVTSGLGGVYPEGLSVGSVAKTEMDSSGLCRRADVTPASDISSLRYVFVVME